MSIDLEIIPRAPPPTWGEVRRAWLGAPGRLPGALLHLGTRSVVSEEERLRPPLAASVDLGAANTLGLMVMKTAGIYDEGEFLADYGRNLSAPELAALASAWRDSGYFVAVSSFMGRAGGELELMVSLAVALAGVVSGRIVVPHATVFDVGVGVYTPDEFARVRQR